MTSQTRSRIELAFTSTRAVQERFIGGRYDTQPRWAESVMRHFLHSPPAVSPLTSRVVSRPAAASLVASTRSAHRLAAPDLTAVRHAVDIPVIAPPADPHLPPTPCAVVEPVASFDERCPSRRNAGRRSSIGACSRRLGSLTLDDCVVPEGPRVPPRAFTLPAATLSYISRRFFARAILQGRGGVPSGSPEERTQLQDQKPGEQI